MDLDIVKPEWYKRLLKVANGKDTPNEENKLAESEEFKYYSSHEYIGSEDTILILDIDANLWDAFIREDPDNKIFMNWGWLSNDFDMDSEFWIDSGRIFTTEDRIIKKGYQKNEDGTYGDKNDDDALVLYPGQLWATEVQEIYILTSYRSGTDPYYVIAVLL